jgi:hypothetical protein
MQSLARPSVEQFSAVVRETLLEIPWRKALADIGLLVVAALTCSLLTR